MPGPKDFSRLLADQGVQADRANTARLAVADKPIYAHLATLCTCAAVGQIEWTLVPKKDGQALEAIDHSGKRDHRANKQYRHSIGGRILTESGVTLVAETSIGSAYTSNRVFPKTIDQSVQRKNGWPDLRYSDVALTRPNGDPDREMKVGIRAIHVASFDPSITLVNENTPNPHQFDELFGVLAEKGGSGVPLDFLSSYKPTMADGEAMKTITTMPEAHFSFHEALGVPEGTLALARQNFAVLAKHLELPYELPDFTQSDFS